MHVFEIEFCVQNAIQFFFLFHILLERLAVKMLLVLVKMIDLLSQVLRFTLTYAQIGFFFHLSHKKNEEKELIKKDRATGHGIFAE